MDSAPNLRGRILQLDGLRGVAIILVLAFHGTNLAVEAGAPQFMRYLIRPVSLGWSGVDLFFVLSGFLIGGILLDARGSKNYFRVFYTRRMLRILPLYFLVLAIGYGVSRSAKFEALIEPQMPWATCITLTQNFWIAAHMKTLMGALVGTWSLAVEEQFYLLIPALIYFTKPQRLAWVVGGGIVAAPLVRLALYLKYPELTVEYVLLPCRMDALLLGVAAAYFIRQKGGWEFLRAHRRALWTAIELLTVICAVITMRESPETARTLFSQVVEYDCLNLLYVGLLLACLVDEQFAKVLRVRWLRGLGAIAYGVYLLHPMILGAIVVLLSASANRGLIAVIAGLALTIVVAKISWEGFEKPLVRASHQLRYE